MARTRKYLGKRARKTKMSRKSRSMRRTRQRGGDIAEWWANFKSKFQGTTSPTAAECLKCSDCPPKEPESEEPESEEPEGSGSAGGRRRHSRRRRRRL